MLRKRGVVSKFVEFFGEGVQNLSLADRATVSKWSQNMEPLLDFSSRPSNYGLFEVN
jgi:aconitase A